MLFVSVAVEAKKRGVLGLYRLGYITYPHSEPLKDKKKLKKYF